MACKQDKELIALDLQTRLTQTATNAAEEAGRELLKMFNEGRISVRRKFDYPGSIVTNADEKAERIILSRIKKSGIQSIVISEESGKIDFGSNDIIWAVDPLDGTLNYAKRIPYFAVSIGCIFKGKPVAGAIYNPVLDEMFTASSRRGARLNGKRIQVSKTKSLKGASLIFEWWNHEPLIPDPLELEKRLYRFTRSVRSPGSVAMNLCTVAVGRFDGLITVFERSPIYEIAAGCLIVEEAGGRVTNSEGRKWDTFRGSVVAANGSIHARILNMIRSR
jgi:myo-inositol-1(or 4)-monophosphatase